MQVTSSKSDARADRAMWQEVALPLLSTTRRNRTTPSIPRRSPSDARKRTVRFFVPKPAGQQTNRCGSSGVSILKLNRRQVYWPRFAGERHLA